MRIKSHLFSTKETIGTVMSIQEPIGENQHYSYKVKYVINTREYFTINNHKIDEQYQIGDKVTLIIDEDDASVALFKGYILGDILCVFLAILLLALLSHIFFITLKNN